MDSTSPDIISQVEQVLERNLSSSLTEDYTQTGGIESVVEVLNSVDRSTERTILDTLEIQDPELADEIRKRMFVFEDIVILDNRAIQRVIREVEHDDLRSEEHTSELQSRGHLVCRLLLEKKTHDKSRQDI